MRLENPSFSCSFAPHYTAFALVFLGQCKVSVKFSDYT
jgi:hypothetical protein